MLLSAVEGRGVYWLFVENCCGGAKEELGTT
jgi:hypothetical protein